MGMTIFQHIYYSIRNGEWHSGFDRDKNKSFKFIQFFHDYYDGNHCDLYVWKFYISSYY